jgi:hypothetical protein
MLSTELLVELGSNGSWEALLSFLRRLRLSISSWPLSSVRERNASNLFRFLSMAKMNCGFSAGLLVSSIRVVPPGKLTAVLMLNDGIDGL